jgi:3-deoxy-manno-octulosonate cytidylyltransferase (CMP-KDO synthetase)
MQAVAIIPSRFGSSRFPGKPLALIAGKPMIQWVYERACQAARIVRVVVATDDDRIAKAVEHFGGSAILTAAENRSGTDRVAEAAAILALAPETLVVNIQGDQPLFAPACIDQLLAPLDGQEPPPMTTLACRIVDPRERTDPKDVKVACDREGFALYFSRAPIPWGRDGLAGYGMLKHLGFYAFKRGFLEIFRALPSGRLEQIEKLEQLRALENGYRIKVVTTAHDSPEVDLPVDIERIENWLRVNGPP